MDEAVSAGLVCELIASCQSWRCHSRKGCQRQPGKRLIVLDNRESEWVIRAFDGGVHVIGWLLPA